MVVFFSCLLGTDESQPMYTYRLTPQLTYHPANMTTLALIKRGQTLDPTAPLVNQLHFLNLFGGEETPYESLHAVVSHGVKPWFDAFVGARGGKDTGDAKMGMSFGLGVASFAHTHG